MDVRSIIIIHVSIKIMTKLNKITINFNKITANFNKAKISIMENNSHPMKTKDNKRMKGVKCYALRGVCYKMRITITITLKFHTSMKNTYRQRVKSTRRKILTKHQK